MTSISAGNDIPRNELKGWRVVAALSTIALCLTVGGLAFDLHVLATHQLIASHRAWDITLLFLFGFGAYAAITNYRRASVRIATLRSHADSN
jgi:hypothetical protein